ncbi:MAG: hypothetical protein O9346_14665 [Leptospiraceae bacterium]|nr:hypothetical protein [Leptospiraceae bacterium]MCZ8347656.1 hypothetical protein [Leptospiraceae bacterium]
MRSKLFVAFICVSLYFNCNTTVDFIPDADYRKDHEEYSKKSWQEVEILLSRPDRRFLIVGTVAIRDFEGTGTLKDYTKNIKKEMFEKKMDGVWISSNKVESVDDTIFTTMDTRGKTTHAYESERQIKIWKGYAFRYRK